ncbi:hypothetical protein JXR93_14670 [bacterium]|nr:hypothetical protein [bacterium]
MLKKIYIFINCTALFSIFLTFNSCSTTDNQIKKDDKKGGLQITSEKTVENQIASESTLNKNDNSEKKSQETQKEQQNIVEKSEIIDKNTPTVTSIPEKDKKLIDLSTKFTTDFPIDKLSDVEKAIYDGDYNRFTSIVGKNKEKLYEKSKLKDEFNLDPIFASLISVQYEMKEQMDFLENLEEIDEPDSSDDDFYSSEQYYRLVDYNNIVDERDSYEKYIKYLEKTKEFVVKKYDNRFNLINKLKKNGYFDSFTKDDIELYIRLSYEIGDWRLFFWSIKSFNISKEFFENNLYIIKESLSESRVELFEYLKKIGFNYLDEKIYNTSAIIYWINTLCLELPLFELSDLESLIKDAEITNKDLKNEVESIKQESIIENINQYFDREIDILYKKIDKIDNILNSAKYSEKDSIRFEKEIEKLDIQITKLEDKREEEIQKFYNYEDHAYTGDYYYDEDGYYEPLPINWKEMLYYLIDNGENPEKLDKLGKNLYNYAEERNYLFISLEAYTYFNNKKSK